ncbi:MAG TPA: response regulator [Solirubrobacterales bacterium]|nr:response regulator [Solirubrobacterales bacterium]
MIRPRLLQALDADAGERAIGVVIQDMDFSPEATGGEEGVALFREIKRRDPGLPVLLITAWTSLATAVQLVKEGASDYLAKPWDDDRPEDVLPLAERFLRALSPAPTGAVWRLVPAAREPLLRHRWPGNVRELANTLRRAVLAATGETIQEADLGLASAPATPALRGEAAAAAAVLGERRKIERALAAAGGVVARAAASLGWSRQALYRKMEKHGLVVERRVKG